MASRREDGGDREALLDEIFWYYLEEREKGSPPTLKELRKRYPQLATDPELLTVVREDINDYETVCPQPRPLPATLPDFGDDYEVLEELGRGGMGVVYKANQRSLAKTVAIKTICRGAWIDDEELARFLTEARRVAGLRHTNIVPVHQVGESSGKPFFVMDHIEGQTLADVVREGPLPPDDAVRYVTAVANAVHYAHQRRILHCDIKPGNVLLDQEHTPYLTDFGLAKNLGEDGRYEARSAIGGTLGYMAPEQALGGELTTATDVYGLGALLYALLTGQAPRQPETIAELRVQVEETPLRPPSTLNASVDEDLKAICMKCLRKEPAERYDSASALSEDLLRYQKLEETSARHWRRHERVTRWRQRNPLLAVALSGVMAIAVLTVAMALFVAVARKTAQVDTALDAITNEAESMASMALLQLGELSDTVERAIADTERLAELLSKNDREGLQNYLTGTFGDIQSSPFETCFILDANGTMLARVWPAEPDRVGLTDGDLSWRDYFQGAKAHADAGLKDGSLVHVSSAYRGRYDALYKFALSAPVVNEHDGFMGVICTSVTTNPCMGLVKTEDSRELVLVGPRDADVKGVKPGGHVVLFHPDYDASQPGARAADFRIPSSVLAGLGRDHLREFEVPSDHPSSYDDAYADPIREGRWIAGFAPVGYTGLLIIVQQSYDEAMHLDPWVSLSLLMGCVLVAGLALTTVAAALWHRTRSRQRG